MLSGDLLDRFYNRIETRVQLAEKLTITIETNLRNYESQMFGEELALLIQKMPDRLQDKKITVDARSLANQTYYMHDFIMSISRLCPLLAFI